MTVNGESTPHTFHQQVGSGDLQRNLAVDFGGPLEVTSLSLRQKNTDDPEPSHVHLWEITWK